jgi:preprotein translocase SecE subunit
MAVAVKTSPGARSSGTLDSPAILSLIGVLYLLACLAIVFKVLPDLWWSVWTASGLPRASFVGGSLLGIVGLSVGVGLLVFGSRLLGPHPPAGVRSGVFVAFTGLVIVLLLTRWVSLWMEHWAYTGSLNWKTGALLTGIMGLVFLAFWVRLFTWPKVQKFVLLLEHGGWFHATAYKSNQGQRVRRGTIFGILLLVGAGIYTLISHGTLRRGSPDWSIVIPFTGKVAVESFGDTEQFFVEEEKTQVQVRAAGDSNLEVGKIIPFSKYQQAVADFLKDHNFGADADAVRTSLDESAKNDDIVVYLKKVDDLIYDKTQKLLTPEIFRDDAIRRLNEVYQQTDVGDLPKLIDAIKTEAGKANRSDQLGPVFSLPIAVLIVDRYTLRDVNAKTEKSQYVKVGLKGDINLVPPFNEKGKAVSEGDIVSRPDFDTALANLEAERKKNRDRELPKEQALSPAYGNTSFDTVTLLPSVQFTVPLLLLAVSLWLAWRIVNMPTFADFLIATEAELNKVSWTTQKRLVQDTIVVLTTVFLMAIFLFGMDWTWKVVLSWKPIGVLHIPKDASDTEKKIEQKRW